MNEQRTILLVEDNQHLNKINGAALRLAGYRVLTALTIGEAKKTLEETEPDAIVLDILLPDGNGVDFCREIRERTGAPILFLTSVTGYEQELEGLRAGGDDYLNKPFRQEMLLARIEAFWRRDEIQKRGRQPIELVRGPLTLRVVAGRALLHGEDLMLTQKEFALLLYLVQYEGRLLDKKTLYENVWGGPLLGDSQALYASISRLKRKLEPACGEGIFLFAKRGQCYCFTYRPDK